MKVYKMLEEQKAIWDMERTYPNTAIGNIGACLDFYNTEDARLYQRMNEVFVKTQSACWLKVNREGNIYFDKVIQYETPICDARDMEEPQFESMIQKWMDEPLFQYDKHLFDLKIFILKDRIAVCEKLHHIIMDGYGVVLSLKIMEDICWKLQQGDDYFQENCQFIHKIESAQNRTPKITPLSVSVDGMAVLGRRTTNPQADILEVCLVRKRAQKEENETKDQAIDYIVWKEFLRKYRISPESMFYGCLALYLCKCQSKAAVAIGRNLLNRQGEELTMAGMCVAMDPFLIEYKEELTMAEFLAGLRKGLAAHANKQERNKLGQDKLSMICSYRPYHFMPVFKGGNVKEYPVHYCEVPIKFFLNDKGGQLDLEVRYQVDAISENEIKALIRKVLFLMQESMQKPDVKLKDLSILQKKDWELYNRANASGNNRADISLPERFLAAAKLNLNKTAVIFGEEQWSYQQVYKRVGMAVAWIEKLARKEPYIIGVCLKRSPWIPILIYAAWLKGYSYLPVSQMESEERKQRISAKCSLFFTDELLCKCRKDTGCYEVFPLEYDKKAAKMRPAYYMFTSGTTGEPKAAMISHKSLAIRLQWMEDEFGTGMDLVMQKTRNTFDVSMWELTFPWAYGKTMCMLQEGEERIPQTIFHKILQHHVTIVHFVPSMFAQFMAYVEKQEEDLPDLLYIILSGETLDASLVKRACRRLKNTTLYNLYGPTECTIDVSYYRCKGDEKRIPIGTSLYQTQLTIRNINNQILPSGQIGELVIEGDLVGEGYSELFAPQEKNGGYCLENGKRQYHTGDMACLGEDGNFYFEGRKDRQKKVRGMRVNLEEVELLLNHAFPMTRHVILWHGNRMIDFYEGELSKDELYNEAKKILPYYCVPSEFVSVEQIPIGKNGKVSSENLLKDYSKYENPDEVVFADIWELERMERTLLDVSETILQKKIHLDASIWEEGMDSLLALQFITACEEYQIKLSVKQIYQAVSIKELARELYDEKEQKDEIPLVFLKQKKEKSLVLMIPFAGGTPLSYGKMANEIKERKVDLAVVNMYGFGQESLEQIADFVVGEIQKRSYDMVYIIASCVGSVLGLCIGKKLQNHLRGMLICEALPYKGIRFGKKYFTVWDFMPNGVVQFLLQKIRGKTFVMNYTLIRQFRKDVRKSAIALRNLEKCIMPCPVYLIFGEKDLLTKGYKKKYKKWLDWMGGKIYVSSIANAKHFMVETHASEIKKVLLEMLEEEAYVH